MKDVEPAILSPSLVILSAAKDLLLRALRVNSAKNLLVANRLKQKQMLSFDCAQDRRCAQHDTGTFVSSTVFPGNRIVPGNQIVLDDLPQSH